MPNDENARPAATQDTDSSNQDITSKTASATQPEPSDGETNTNRAGSLGLATIILANVATFTGAIAKVNEQVQKLQEQLHLSATPDLLYILVAVISVGYLLASTSLYKHLKERFGNKMPGKRIAAGVLVFLVMGGLYAVNVSAIPNSASTILKSRKDIWSDKIRGTQQDGGGFSIMLPSGPGNPVQVFVTAQGLTAILSAMDWNKLQQDQVKTIRSAFDFIDSQRDPVEGLWGYFGNSTPLTEIAGWVTVARIKALEHSDEIWSSESEKATQLDLVETDLKRIMTHYVHAENAWSPFLPNIAQQTAIAGCSGLPPTLTSLTDDQSKARTYSTVMALWALIEAHRVASVHARVGHKYDDDIRTGIGWMLSTYSKEVGTWFPNPRRANQTDDYMGLTGQALYVLYLAEAEHEFAGAVQQPRWGDARRGFLDKDVKGQLIGDNSHLSDMDGYVFPFPQPLEPMTFLWAPWSMVAYHYMSIDSDLSESEKKMAATKLSIIESDYQDRVLQSIESGGTYQLCESLFGLSEATPK
jgi:hypothetical protein